MLHDRDLCRARGIGRLRLGGQSDNAAAIRFYERIGATMRTKGISGWDV